MLPEGTVLRVTCYVQLVLFRRQLYLFLRPDFRDNAVGDDYVLVGADGGAPFRREERAAGSSGIGLGGAPKQETQVEGNRTILDRWRGNSLQVFQ